MKKKRQTFEERVQAMNPSELDWEKLYWEVLVDRYQDISRWGWNKLQEAKNHLAVVCRAIRRAEQQPTLDAAYCAGFEPSSDTLTDEALYQEAQAYLEISVTF
jgi:hypothetical protein